MICSNKSMVATLTGFISKCFCTNMYTLNKSYINRPCIYRRQLFTSPVSVSPVAVYQNGGGKRAEGPSIEEICTWIWWINSTDRLREIPT